MSNCLSSPFHRDNSAKQPLVMKTNSVITFPQNHFSSAFCFSFSSFSYWWVPPSPAISKNNSVVLFSFGKCSPGNTVSRQWKSINPKHVTRNWMNLTTCNKSIQKYGSGESYKNRQELSGKDQSHPLQNKEQNGLTSETGLRVLFLLQLRLVILWLDRNWSQKDKGKAARSRYFKRRRKKHRETMLAKSNDATESIPYFFWINSKIMVCSQNIDIIYY